VTRGRANTLRLALSGQLGEEGLASDDVREALDLCVSCKGCKRDCPTGIDMASIKIEAKAAWVERHGVSLRETIVAYMPHYASIAAKFAGILGFAERIPGITPRIKQWMGFAPQRSMPRFRRSYLAEAARGEGAAPVITGKPEVVLFVDTFNNHIEPDNARAARRVLEAAGYRVQLPVAEGGRPVCCGRTFLAAGLVDKAKAEARRLLDTFLPFVRRGVPVVGLEPSCLLTLRDECLNYGWGDEAQVLADSSFLFEEFLVREQRQGRLALNLKSIGTPYALLHGHCHQKAFDALTPVQQVLGWIPGLELRTVESSCCGGAGSFGYEAEHYEASQAMAELSLFPAVRKLAPGALMVADGTSCRHQIEDGAGVEALHVARVLEMALG